MLIVEFTVCPQNWRIFQHSVLYCIALILHLKRQTEIIQKNLLKNFPNYSFSSRSWTELFQSCWVKAGFCFLQYFWNMLMEVNENTKRFSFVFFCGFLQKAIIQPFRRIGALH